MRTISNNKPNSNQSAPDQMKTDQEILEELKQAGGGERKRSFGLTAFIILLAIIIGVFTYMNRRDQDEQTAEEANSVAVTETSEDESSASDESSESSESQDAATTSDESTDATEPTESSEESAESTDEQAESSDATEDESTSTSEESTGVSASSEAVGEEPNAQSTHTDTAYSEVAQVGEGVTHLARRALHGYLAEQGVSDITAEHKVFIEDYLAKQVGPYWIDIGHSQTFEVSMLDQAIAAARALTPDQLANLEQYSALVPGL